jgi:hypothetical protein
MRGQLCPLPRHGGVVDLGQRPRVPEPSRDEPRLSWAPDRADATVERAVVVERVPVHGHAEAVEEVTRLAEGRIPGWLGVVRGGRLDVRGQPLPPQPAAKLVRLAGPVDTGRVRARGIRVIVARAAREVDRRGGALRQAADVALGVAEHRRRDPVVRCEPAGEEDRPVVAMLERRLAEVEHDDAVLVPAGRGAALGAQDPRFEAVLVDGEGRRLEVMQRPLLSLRRVPVRRLGLRPVQPYVRVRREARDETVGLPRTRSGQSAAGGREGEHESGSDRDYVPFQKHLPTSFAG